MIFKVIRKCLFCLWLMVPFHPISGSALAADTRIAVLAFDLKDLTLTQNSRQEVERAASIKPLLQRALEKQGEYEMVQVDRDAQMKVEPGYGYLFSHHDVAADLGEKFGAEYVVVGRLHKPSALFVYLMAHLVDVKARTLVGDYIIEVKGTEKRITEKGVETLAKQLHETLQP